MSRPVLTAGLLAVAALGLGVVSAQAAPAASGLTGFTSHNANAVEKTHWRERRWYRRHHHHHHRWHRHRWWW